MGKKAVLVLATMVFASGALASEPPRPASPAPQTSGSRLLDLERWLAERMRQLASPFGTRGPDRDQAGPQKSSSDTASTCDPSRSHCPIG